MIASSRRALMSAVILLAAGCGGQANHDVPGAPERVASESLAVYDSVRNGYLDFTATNQIEGVVNHMYLDKKGLVTVGIGTLIEDTATHQIRAEALGYAFTIGGQPASRQDIINDFNAVKQGQPTRLVLSDAEMSRLVRAMLGEIEATVRHVPEFSGLDGWPADAQFALFSMAYGLGAHFGEHGKWPSFRAACGAQDFMRAARESRMRESDNPNVKPRNWANELMFVYAARVAQLGRPRDQLVFPNILTSSGQFIDMGLAPRHVVWPTLKVGSSGRQVEALQTLLGLTPTGTFDGATKAAVVQFQATATDRDGKPLATDGVVGLQTWRALVMR